MAFITYDTNKAVPCTFTVIAFGKRPFIVTFIDFEIKTLINILTLKTKTKIT